MRLTTIAQCLGSDFPKQATDITLTGISINSRDLESDNLFIAIKGENFDGHCFVDDAIAKGAAAVVVQHAKEYAVPSFVVSDTRQALGQLAQHFRQQFNIPVIGITGSCGKTTVKEMVANILKQRAEVLVSVGNQNNTIGVPLTLLRLNTSHQYAVIEMGTNQPGEIAQLTQWVQPTLSVITTIAPAHLAGLGCEQGVLEEKTNIFRYLSEDGLAIYPGDSPHCEYWQQALSAQLPHGHSEKLSPHHSEELSPRHSEELSPRHCEELSPRYSEELSPRHSEELSPRHCEERSDEAIHKKSLSFGLKNSTIIARNVQLNPEDSQFELITPVGTIAIQLNIPGRHHVMNALAAAAVAHGLQIPLRDIQQGLAEFSAVKGRFLVQQGVAGIRLIDDSYNANIASVQAAIEQLARYPGQRILVFGDMGELGEQAPYYHQRVGELAQDLGIERLYTVGNLSAQYTAKSFGQAAQSYHSINALLKDLIPQLKTDCTVLVKGSLSMGMSAVVTALSISD